MTAGMHTANLANKWLDMLGGTAFTAPANTYVQLHTGDPGAAGTANTSGTTTRKQVTFAAAVNGGNHSSNAPLWDGWAAGTETITHISVWDASSGGNVLFTAALTSNNSIAAGESLALNWLAMTASPLMA